MSTPRIVVLLAAGWLLCGCESRSPAPADPYAPSSYPTSGYPDDGYGSGQITFLAEAPSNASTEVGLSDLAFTTVEGETTHVRDLAGPHGTIVVVTRGNTNPICPYCSTQTADYIRDYAQFQGRGVQVVIVYPIESRSDTGRLNAFLTDARTRLGDPERPVPFPVLFDVELSAVDQLGIRKDLSKPATYIVDDGGHVTYAYVGAHWGDRPAVSAVLQELDRRGITAPGPDPPETPPVVDPAAPGDDPNSDPTK